MGVEADTAYEVLAQTEYCYINQGAKTTPYPGSDSTNNKKVEAESFVDSGVDTDEQVEDLETAWTTDNADVTDDFYIGETLVLNDGSFSTEIHKYVSGSGVIATVEREYDGTTGAGNISSGANIFKSVKDMEVTLCTFTVKDPTAFGITKDAILKNITFDMVNIPGSGTMYIGLLKSDFSPALANWNTSDGSAVWVPRYRGGSKGQEKIYKHYVTTTSRTASLQPFVDGFGLTWGSKVNLAIWHNATVIGTSSSSTTLGALQYKVTYEDPAPETPQITIEANDDGLTWWDQRTGSPQTATIKVVNGLDDEDLAQHYLTTNTSNSDGTLAATDIDAYNDNSGPHLTTTDTGLREFSTGEMSTSGMADENKFSYYRMFVEDVKNVTANATASNVTRAVRPSISSATTHDSAGTAAASFSVGDLVELRVVCDSTLTTNRHHAGGPAKGKIKKVYVNWNASPHAEYVTNLVIGITTDMNDSVTDLVVTRQNGLDGYVYAAGTNEVYLILDSTGAGETAEVVKVSAIGGDDTTYTIARAQLGTAASAHTASGSSIYIYSPADVPQQSLYNVGDTEGRDNYVEYDLPSPVSSTIGNIKLTHRYPVDATIVEARTGTPTFYYYREYKTIRVVVEDELGFRSDAATLADINIAESPPVAVVNVSRGESAIASTAGDRETAVVLSGANSYARGGGRTIKEYRWTCTPADAADIVTSGVLDINNEPLEAASRKLYARSNKAAYDEAVITIIGLASFDADGSSIADDSAGFNDGYYKYTKATVSPGTDAGTTAGTGWGLNAVSAADGAVYFKQVDFVYVSTIDSGTASASEIYQLFSSDADGTEPTAHDKSRCVVPRLCVDVDQNLWGGLVKIAATADSGGTTGYGARITASATSQSFKSNASGGHEDFIGDGFAPGDYMVVKGGFTDANQGVYLIDKVELAGGVFAIYVDTSFKKVDSTETITPTTKKEMYVAKSAISVACESEATEVFNLIVADVNDAVSLAATVSVPFRIQSTLDLDAAHSAGNIAIQSVKINRGSTLNANMPIGMRSYPVGTMHTKYGMPTLSMSVRAMDDTGFAYMTQLIDNRYNFAKYAYNKIASSETAYVTYKLKLQSWSVDRKPEQTSHEIYSLNFVISGESV